MIPRTLFTPEHELFRDQVRRFIAAEIAPHHAAWEKAGIVPRSAWLKAGEGGFLCTAVPEEYGGAGGDFLHGAIMVEEMARAGATGPTFYLQSEIISPYLVRHGTEAQKRRWLPGMAKGTVVASLGMSEPSGGSDVANIRTTAIRDGDDYVVNGQKVFITAGHSSDLLLLACKTDPKAGAKGVSLLLVDTTLPGYQRGRLLEKIGCKAQDTAELFFQDMRVPADCLLGEEGRGFAMLMGELPQERLVQAIRAVASSEAAIGWTLDHAVQRRMFGQTLADFQNTRFRLAEMRADTQAQRVFLDRCIELHLEGRLSAVDAAMLKLTTTELQGRVMDQCLQLFGGWGYMTEFPIARAFVDARLGRIGGGAVEVMKEIISRDMLPKNPKPARG
ncbi:acyl-CoA dehydrogenase family protein [Falsiroseomonas sp. CW058]|uniref:acyl-CoA dehydrogenase family protein n=1 Tax=Falsiroseomonas sp. CW058 TaxID=3388664 RepID=UPI003D31CD1C